MVITAYFLHSVQLPLFLLLQFAELLEAVLNSFQVIHTSTFHGHSLLFPFNGALSPVYGACWLVPAPRRTQTLFPSLPGWRP